LLSAPDEEVAWDDPDAVARPEAVVAVFCLAFVVSPLFRHTSTAAVRRIREAMASKVFGFMDGVAWFCLLED
jgi:hypothetical protein